MGRGRLSITLALLKHHRIRPVRQAIACFNNPYSTDAVCQFKLFKDEKTRLAGYCTENLSFHTRADEAGCMVVRDNAPCITTPFDSDNGCLDNTTPTVLIARENRISYCDKVVNATGDVATVTGETPREICHPVLYYCAINPGSESCPDLLNTIVDVCRISSESNDIICGVNTARWTEPDFATTAVLDDKGTLSASDDETIETPLTFYANRQAVPFVDVEVSENVGGTVERRIVKRKIGFLKGANSGLGEEVVTTDEAEDARRRAGKGYLVGQSHARTLFTETYTDSHGNLVNFGGPQRLGAARGGFGASNLEYRFESAREYTYNAQQPGVQTGINQGRFLPSHSDSEPAVIAYWRGQLRFNAATTPDQAFILEINLTERKLSIAGGGLRFARKEYYGTGSGGVSSTKVDIYSILTLNATYNTSGVVTGTVRRNYDTTPGGNPNDFLTADNKHITSKSVSVRDGLISEDGVVANFGADFDNNNFNMGADALTLGGSFIAFPAPTGEYYAGILPDTYVGQYLPLTKPTATWIGTISTNYRKTRKTQVTTAKSTDYDFTLTVDFQNRILTTASRTFEDFGGLRFENLRYDNAGLITGRVRIIGQTVNYALTGLIGTEAAVGAFVGDGFSGGFIAAPVATAGVITTAQFRDWRDESTISAADVTFTKGDKLSVLSEVSTTDAYANFLAGGTYRQYLRGTSEATVNRNWGDPRTGVITLTLGDAYSEDSGNQYYSVNLTGEKTNGVSFFAIDFDTATGTPPIDERLYSGLLASTTLTAPVLSQNAADVTWKGRFALLSNNSNAFTDATIDTYLVTKNDFAITLSFDTNDRSEPSARSFTGRRFESTFTITNPASTTRPLAFTIRGTFDANGVLRGRTFLAQAGQTKGLGIDGYITGLVGAEGIVASFASFPGETPEKTYGHYVGGFVAVPTVDPSEPDSPLPNREAANINFATWKTDAVKELTPRDTSTEPVTDATYEPLTFLTGISTTDTAEANFVVGGATGLSRDIIDTDGTIESGVSTGQEHGLYYGAINANYADRGTREHDLSTPLTLTLGDTYSHGEKDFNLDGDVADGVSFMQGDGWGWNAQVLYWYFIWYKFGHTGNGKRDMEGAVLCICCSI